MKSTSHELRIFVSSTSEDLRDYRGIARNVILKMGWYPEMMEYFGASPTPTVDACREKIKGCDAMLLLVAFRRGWVPDKEQGGNGIDSVTALELAHARENKIPVLAMLADENWPVRLVEEDDEARKWVKKFRGELNLPAEFFRFEDPAGPETERLPAFRTKVSEVLLAHLERLLAEATKPDKSVTNINYFASAYDTLQDGNGIPFLGPGIYSDGPLGSAALIKALLGEESSYKTPCLATAAEYRERFSKSRDELLKKLRRIIEEQSAEATIPTVYDLIVTAPRPPFIVSVTYDRLLEQSLEQANKPYAVVTHILNSEDHAEDGKILLFRGNTPPEICLADRVVLDDKELVIYKPLGSPLLHDRLDPDLAIDTVVITETDHLTFLGRLQHQNTQIPTCFSKQFKRRPLLFLGYDLDVWNYRLIMQVFSSVGGRGRDKLTLAVREPASPMEDLAWNRLGADLISLDPNEFAQKVQSKLATERSHD